MIAPVSYVGEPDVPAAMTLRQWRALRAPAGARARRRRRRRRITRALLRAIA